MALLQYLEEGQFSTNLETGDYKVIVIGPGGDGGGAWTNGKDGAKAIAPGRGVNGKGGNGGIGGLGAVWLMKLKNNTTKTH